MSSIAFCLPAALQLVMPSYREVSQSVPSADSSSNYPSERGVFTEVKKAPLVCLHEPLTLQQCILAHEADKEPENDETEFLDAACVYVARRHHLDQVEAAYSSGERAQVSN
ncbi:hypothetical protein conserved [Leishmania donovani]|uniref:Uncharacterized protein n=3 Tax=Leishmania donovani species complex TaxID=38574 RepID=A4I6G7_LEIIN|nr:hypothetical protein, unknown function [Leishmania infantum JPCM5]XP_003863166.1 hypothetical protein, unknown function [Leishmania donovani]CAC9518062.1 hypothetical_protein_-_conserved [Leishmania infantum]TPP41548.1 hypothetical protein CGC20_3790 [Leishmania donovani]TPP42701.1 hypothetical protein CGC21_11930 [Leishmania donovani]CAJ1991258.1 hypothetical protein conserved [Leishmania donovani]CAM70392.1 hypothetical protein, unknown function [Leishmania infantum JPCM5]|eukprot:XP_001467336.1 hypothetical protein, unknown function [Leishmania infantum JPCM5]